MTFWWLLLVACFKDPLVEQAPVWIRLCKRRALWTRPAVSLERNFHGHPLARLQYERRVEQVVLEEGWEKVPIWQCLHLLRQAQIFYHNTSTTS